MTRVTVRLFAAAADAAGTEETTVDAGGGASRGGATVGAVIDLLAATYGGELRRVLDRCSFLLDGERVGPEVPISGGETLDVLPPFAGG
ncbi:MAG: MoaD/ThiS family protein [Pseudoclavibacter sp.]